MAKSAKAAAKSAAANGNTKTAKVDPLDAKLGPSRTIAKVVKTEKNRRLVRLSCGHERHIQLTPRKTLRCRRCSKEAK